MSLNLLTSKIAAPYVRALFNISAEKHLIYQITEDFQNLNILFNKRDELTKYLNNPTVSQKAKRKFLIETVEPLKIHIETFKFLMVLIDRNRINLLHIIIFNYLKLVYQTVSIKIIEVSTATIFTNTQKDILMQKLKQLINRMELVLIINKDSSLIGGFFIKTESKIIDFTVKNQLHQLAKHLGTILEI